MHEVLENINKSAKVLTEESVPSDQLGRLTDAQRHDAAGDRARAPAPAGGVRRLRGPPERLPRGRDGDRHRRRRPRAGSPASSASTPGRSRSWTRASRRRSGARTPTRGPRRRTHRSGGPRRVDGGYLFTGQWPYSTGTDHSEWVILGGFVLDEQGEIGGPPDMRHFVIPRADYEIVEDSWNVMGLQGTGSKDVRMKDVFVPDYRVVEAMTMVEGGYEHRQAGKPLYGVKFPIIFSAAIAAGTQGIAQGALAVYHDYMTTRVSVAGNVAKNDAAHLVVYGEAAADVAASRVPPAQLDARALRPRRPGAAR